MSEWDQQIHEYLHRAIYLFCLRSTEQRLTMVWCTLLLLHPDMR